MTFPYAAYILKCSNNQYYTGFSANLEKRMNAHQNREVHFTKDKLPFNLVHVSYFMDKKKSIQFRAVPQIRIRHRL